MVDLIIILFQLKLDNFFFNIKMSYYWFNRQELLQKVL